VCNAVPDEAAIAVRRNDAGRLVSGLQYGTCANGKSPIREHDELALLSPTLGSWIFQVGELPVGLSHLVVVFEQHASGRPSFRSVALPEAHGGSASVAIVDTSRFGGIDKRTALRVEPAARPAAAPPAQPAIVVPEIGAEPEPAPAEPLDLAFDKVYTIDPGDFQVSLADIGAPARGHTALHADPEHAYVVLRTGRPERGWPETLQVFSAGAAAFALLLPGLLVD
jgi:hypothetical protein